MTVQEALSATNAMIVLKSIGIGLLACFYVWLFIRLARRWK